MDAIIEIPIKDSLRMFSFFSTEFAPVLKEFFKDSAGTFIYHKFRKES
jgi:hypothetical protein